MKLFYFNPNNYGEEAFVCAESLEEAKKALINTKKEVTSENKYDAEYHNKKIDDMISCKRRRTIDVFEPGQVVFSEIC